MRVHRQPWVATNVAYRDFVGRGGCGWEKHAEVHRCLGVGAVVRQLAHHATKALALFHNTRHNCGMHTYKTQWIHCRSMLVRSRAPRAAVKRSTKN